MIILKRIEIKNFRNIKEAVLDNCGDFNIIIGPPNCGKTNILNAINMLTCQKESQEINYFWNPESVKPSSDNFNLVDINNINLCLKPEFRLIPPRCKTNKNDAYLRKYYFKINFEFSEEYIKDLLMDKNMEDPKDFIEVLEDIKKYFKNLLFSKKNSFSLASIVHKINFLLHKPSNKEIFIVDNLTQFKIEISDEEYKQIEKLFETIENYKYTVSLVQDVYSKNYALPDAVSLLYIKGVFDHIKVLLIQDNRIKEYGNKSLKEYIKDKNMASQRVRDLLELIEEIGDPYLTDLTIVTFDLKKEIETEEIETEEFETSIEEQGSGIRSLICALGDIISLKEPSIILFDEPEIGLNPLAKQKLLEFLLKQSEDHQIFITTHDPTFVNPLFWKDKKLRISAYLYSPYEEKFVKINIEENKEDPNTFAGYLPHTHSLKDIHIYVEGSSDVYIFEVFLNKYVEKNIKKENKYEMLNKVGIYHLGGDFWEHLLYTIPKQPYRCLVILDGDKKERVKEVIEKYNWSRYGLNKWFKFKFCEKVEDVAKILNKKKFLDNIVVPIYCLKEEKIEKYLYPNGVPSNFRKKIDGPSKAEEIELPEEIERLFKVILK